MYNDELYHFGVKGMKWGHRRYQNTDGSYKAQGKGRYNSTGGGSKSSSGHSKLKTAAKIAGGVAGAAALAGGAYALHKSGVLKGGRNSVAANAIGYHALNAKDKIAGLKNSTAANAVGYHALNAKDKIRNSKAGTYARAMGSTAKHMIKRDTSMHRQRSLEKTFNSKAFSRKVAGKAGTDAMSRFTQSQKAARAKDNRAWRDMKKDSIARSAKAVKDGFGSRVQNIKNARNEVGYKGMARGVGSMTKHMIKRDTSMHRQRSLEKTFNSKAFSRKVAGNAGKAAVKNFKQSQKAARAKDNRAWRDMKKDSIARSAKSAKNYVSDRRTASKRRKQAANLKYRSFM